MQCCEMEADTEPLHGRDAGVTRPSQARPLRMDSGEWGACWPTRRLILSIGQIERGKDFHNDRYKVWDERVSSGRRRVWCVRLSPIVQLYV